MVSGLRYCWHHSGNFYADKVIDGIERGLRHISLNRVANQSTEEFSCTRNLEKVRPHEISALLRGESETISTWSESWNARRFTLHVAIIIVGAGFYGRGDGLVARPAAGALCGNQISR